MNQPLAYVHPGAKIAKNVVVEPFTTINNDVLIGEGTWIGSNVTIMEAVVQDEADADDGACAVCSASEASWKPTTAR